MVGKLTKRFSAKSSLMRFCSSNGHRILIETKIGKKTGEINAIPKFD
jgi:hypothetical protein